MSKIVKEVVIVSGQYTNANGESKNRYQKIGAIIETAKGPMLKIESIPVKEGGWDGWAYLNDPKPKEEYVKSQPNYPKRPSVRSFEDQDIPF